MVVIVGHDDGAQGEGMGRNQQIHRADGLAAGLEFMPNSPMSRSVSSK
jgi:hypothetical protein